MRLLLLLAWFGSLVPGRLYVVEGQKVDRYVRADARGHVEFSLGPGSQYILKEVSENPFRVKGQIRKGGAR